MEGSARNTCKKGDPHNLTLTSHGGLDLSGLWDTVPQPHLHSQQLCQQIKAFIHSEVFHAPWQKTTQLLNSWEKVLSESLSEDLPVTPLASSLLGYISDIKYSQPFLQQTLLCTPSNSLLAFQLWKISKRTDLQFVLLLLFFCLKLLFLIFLKELSTPSPDEILKVLNAVLLQQILAGNVVLIAANFINCLVRTHNTKPSALPGAAFGLSADAFLTFILFLFLEPKNCRAQILNHFKPKLKLH